MKMKLLCFACPFFALAQIGHAQGILGPNLIQNGNAEAGPAVTAGTTVVTIPNWTVGGGSPTVLSYNVKGDVQTATDPAPPDHGFQYFGIAVNRSSTLTQNIDVSSAATLISGGNIKYTASAFLGATTGVGTVPAQVSVAFENAKGQVFNTITVGPGGFRRGSGLSQQQQIGLVPAGTVTIAVTLTLSSIFGIADSLSLVLTPLSTTPSSVLGANLIVNGNAEGGPSGAPDSTTSYVPGWSTDGGASVCPYGGAGWISATAPGPVDRGVSLFCGGLSDAAAYQDLDVSAAATQIDAGQINYQVAAWLGTSTAANSPTLTYTFFDWSGKQLAPTAQIGPNFIPSAALVSLSHSDVLPAGTRRVHIVLTFPAYFCVADDISFSIGSLGAPVITPGGVVPVFSTSTTIEPSSWVSIYGTGLASAFASWNGDFPTTLGGTSVTINSKPAYLWFVSPTQINLQAPDDAATGPVSVVVTTAAGTSLAATVSLAPYAPSFSMFNGKYPAAIVGTVGTPGNSGNGWDNIGPGGSALPFTSRPVKAGETVLLFGVGFGPTTPPVPAGTAYSGAAASPTLPTVTIGGVQATVTFAGIIEAGLFQLNVVVPGAGTGDKALVANIGGVTTPANVFLSIQ